jgi:hypothetical protein
MKNRTVILAILAVVLLGAAYLVLQKPGEQSVSSGGRALLSLDSAATDRIEISSPAGAVVLSKQTGEWRLERPLDFRADQTVVASLLHGLNATTVASVASDRPDKHAVFQVDSSGTRVRVFSGGTERGSVVFGKTGGVPFERYARLSASSEVVLIDAGPGLEPDRPLRDWRDRTVFSRAREQISTVVFRYGDTTFTLALRDSAWTVDGMRAKLEAVNGLLSAISALDADDFADNVVAPRPRLTAQVTVGETPLRFAYQKASNTYLVQSSSSAQWYVLEPWKANRILLRRSQLADADR